jgi:hypothetical protein
MLLWQYIKINYNIPEKLQHLCLYTLISMVILVELMHNSILK